MIDAARTPEARPWILFALRSGARASEQLALRWGDIDWHGNKVGFQRSAIRGVEGPTKSGRVRHVPMSLELAAALEAARHLRSALVLCRPDGKPLTLWQLHTALETACRRAGLRQVRWHDLRHSFASQLATNGVPLRRIQEWLGHSTIHMTMRYAHLAPSGMPICWPRWMPARWLHLARSSGGPASDRAPSEDAHAHGYEHEDVHENEDVHEHGAPNVATPITAPWQRRAIGLAVLGKGPAFRTPK